jgi:uncharacterized membrane protein YhaH (DUF805 family)
MFVEILCSFGGSFAALVAFTFLAQSAWLRRAIAVVVRRLRDNELNS